MIKFTTSADFEVKDLTFALDALEKVKANPMSGWLAPWELLESPAVKPNTSNAFESPQNTESENAQNLEVPESIRSENAQNPELAKIKTYAAKIQSDSDFLVCLGIGGSYLGHKAVLDALDGAYEPSHTKILYAGNSLSSHGLKKVINTISGHDFSLSIISKSGTTIEPNLAFEALKPLLEEKYGDEAKNRIYATTDATKGALHDEAVVNDYHRLIVPDSVGGRYSVLTSVGLLPLAVAGVNIDELLSGAKSEAAQYLENSAKIESAQSPEEAKAPSEAAEKSALSYATLRAALAQEGFSTEIFATFDPRLASLNEWLKQLFGESEGKDGAGIFPASVIYSTDLHSLGQYLQDGRRNIFETFLKLPEDSQNSTIATKNAPVKTESTLRTLDKTNHAAEAATISAHRTGGIPVLEIASPDLSARSLGALLYFFELTCAVSATLQGTNPFDQPGVELYKSNLRASLK